MHNNCFLLILEQIFFLIRIEQSQQPIRSEVAPADVSGAPASTKPQRPNNGWRNFYIIYSNSFSIII